MEVEEIKRKLWLIFSFYASFGDRMNIDNLKSAKFKWMMQDCGISKIVPQRQLDILFSSETHKTPNMNFETFLRVLTKLAMVIYPQWGHQTAVEGFHKLLYDHMLPVWEEIMQNPNQQTLYILQNEIQFDELLEYLIWKVGPALYQVYFVYFKWELTTSWDVKQIRKKSEKSFFEFLWEFDLCPDLITKTIAF